MARPPLLLLLVLCVGAALGSLVDLHKRVVNGQVCGRNDRRYHVQLWINDGNGDKICGGSLIRRQWILTATHCLEQFVTITAILGVHPDPAQGVPVEITQPPVIFTKKLITHDIALLRLTAPAPPHIPTVALPNCQHRLGLGDRIQVAGHASTTMDLQNERQPGTVTDLHCAELSVVSCAEIRHGFRNPFNWNKLTWLAQKWLCGQDTRQPPVVDICLGDSGGGVVDTATHTLYGVNSFTGNRDVACAAPFAFMDVCEYMDWINEKTAAQPPPPRQGCGLNCAG